jgi:hypothetical protein
MKTFVEYILEKRVEEDGVVAANATGPGNVAGMGTGPKGEPGVNPKNKRNPILGMVRRKP